MLNKCLNRIEKMCFFILVLVLICLKLEKFIILMLNLMFRCYVLKLRWCCGFEFSCYGEFMKYKLLIRKDIFIYLNWVDWYFLIFLIFFVVLYFFCVEIKRDFLKMIFYFLFSLNLNLFVFFCVNDFSYMFNVIFFFIINIEGYNKKN